MSHYQVTLNNLSVRLDHTPIPAAMHLEEKHISSFMESSLLMTVISLSFYV